MKDGEVKVSTKYRVQNRNTKEEVAQYVSLNHNGGQQYELPSINVIVWNGFPQTDLRDTVDEFVSKIRQRQIERRFVRLITHLD